MFRTNWTNACEIFRDLSVAQGDVPVRVEGTTLGAGDKPPALNLKEETEEEFFQCSGGGAVDEGPDLGLIQEMLDMVRDENLSDDENIFQEEAIVITKPHLPPQPEPAPVKPKKAKEKKQKRRNIALESFIGIDITPKTELKLLKPEELITKHSEPDLIKPSEPALINLPEPVTIKPAEPDLIAVESAIDKVKDWLLSNEGTVTKKPTVCLQPPTNMFRKKNKIKSPIGSPQENLSIKTDSNSKSPSQSELKEFVPSAHAVEYGNKLKEKAKLKENMVEDIWTRAEKQMKLMDEKRKAEAAAIGTLANNNNTVATTDEEISTSSEHLAESTNQSYQLPGHRHLLTDDCVVCQAFKEFGYSGYCQNV